MGQSDDSELRKAALRTTALLMKVDKSVCVQLLKVNLLSNLILSVYPGSDAETRLDVEQILVAAVDCPHRLALLTRSEDFKPERLRLQRMLNDAKKLKIDKTAAQKHLKDFLFCEHLSKDSQR